MSADPDQLQRFVEAQQDLWPGIERELRAGRKTSHWMWFVFPQLAVLGRSPTAKFYGLRDAGEARAYLAHPVLGSRLIDGVQLLLQVRGRTADQIFGSVDAMKLRSCLTLFAAVAPQEAVFRECLQRYFGGLGDELTLQALGGG